MYRSDPTFSLDVLIVPTLAIPKSMIFMDELSLVESKMFSSLRSRWITFDL